MALTTIAQAISDGAGRLQGIADRPRHEARLLLAHALGATQNDLIRDPGRLIDPVIFETALARRCAREPLALITGQREFWSMTFNVSHATLIPRPDSETLIEAALSAFSDRTPPRTVLDLGTGTGCLLLSLLREFPTAFGVGIDLAPDAASLARGNARALGLLDRSAFVVGEWAAPLRGRFDLVVSNPPYIRSLDIPLLMPEVARFEPNLALDGGADGYAAYRSIILGLAAYLAPSGIAILELGQGQASYVEALARAAGFRVSLRLDLAEIPRVTVLAR